MFWFMLLVPTTAIVAGEFIVMVHSRQADGFLKSFGHYLATWIYILAGLYFVGAIAGAVTHGRMMGRGMMGQGMMHGGMMGQGMRGQGSHDHSKAGQEMTHRDAPASPEQKPGAAPQPAPAEPAKP